MTSTVRFSAPYSAPAVPRAPAAPFLYVLPLLLVILMAGNSALAQGALTNGWLHTGTIAPAGDSDTWTFSANAGDHITIRIGEISQTNTFAPRIRLQNPNAVQMAAASGAVATEI